jgi:hypothetical protein
VRVVGEGPRRLTVEVEYSLNRAHGSGVFLVVRPVHGDGSSAPTGHPPTVSSIGVGQRSQVTVQPQSSTEVFTSSTLVVELRAAGVDGPLAQKSVAFDKTWSHPSVSLLQSVQLAAAPPAPSVPTPTASACEADSQVVERRFSGDGAVEIVYADGTIRQISDGSVTTIHPDGRHSTMSHMNSQPPTPPPPPLGGGPLDLWLQAQNNRLLGTIGALVRNDSTSFRNYQAAEPAGLSPYDRMSRHTATLTRLLGAK